MGNRRRQPGKRGKLLWQAAHELNRKAARFEKARNCVRHKCNPASVKFVQPDLALP